MRKRERKKGRRGKKIVEKTREDATKIILNTLKKERLRKRRRKRRWQRKRGRNY